MGSKNKDQEKKKIPEVKTFPVPFALGEIKENISIKTPSKPSKEQIINQAIQFHQKGNILEAERSYQYFINQGFKDHTPFSNYGVILKDLGKLQEAELLTRKAITLNPSFAMAHSNLGIILKDLGKLQEAELSARKAITLNPSFAMAHSNLGIILKDLGKLEKAEMYTREAIKIKPDYAEAYSNLGSILRGLWKLEEAEIYTRKAIQINPNFTDAYSNLGGILKELGKLEEAEFFTLKAISLKPDCALMYSNMGIILSDLGKYNDAIKFFNKSLKLNANLDYSKWGLITSKGKICDWSDQETQNKWLEKLGIEGPSIIPHALFYYEDNPIKQLQRAENLYKEKYNRKSERISNLKNKKIHIGYFSADFRAHPMMYLMSSMFKLHDKSQFNIYLYSFVNKEDKYTSLAKESGCIFRDIKNLNDIEAVELARNDKLDIAIDRMGYVNGHRMNIFSYRVAPIQIHYMAYAGSLGSKNIDYLIADNIIIPKEYEKYYSEKIIRMPNSYQCNDSTKEIDKKPISRNEFNLPDKAFIFTCFCANKKITPKEFDIWMQLLRTIKGSILWLYKSNQYSLQNLKYEATKRNIDPDRLIFANHLPVEEHLARHSLGDLGLDTFNYNGHTTTSDALWAGLPVITKTGKSFASRVSASILTSIGLTELITHNEKEYEEKALDLAWHPDKLMKIKSKLNHFKKTSPLYNSELFTRDLEAKLKELIKK